MTKSDIEWAIESSCRIAMNYSGYRCAFFNRLNVVLCVLSIASLWCSGFVFSNGKELAACVLDIVGAVLLVADVVLNLMGCNGFWKSMRNGYYELYSEFVEIRSKASEDELEKLQARLAKFDSRCDAEYNALGLIAWNDACVQMGKPEHVKHVPWYKWLTANLFSWGTVAENFKD